MVANLESAAIGDDVQRAKVGFASDQLTLIQRDTQAIVVKTKGKREQLGRAASTVDYVPAEFVVLVPPAVLTEDPIALEVITAFPVQARKGANR